MADNYSRITAGFQTLTEVLAPLVAQQLQAWFGKDWWQRGVLDILLDTQRRDLPPSSKDEASIKSLDAARCLVLMDQHWNEVFKLNLSRDHRNWIKELIATRNKWAHKGVGDLSDEDAWRALDTGRA